MTITYRVDPNITNSAYPLRVEFFKADASGQGKTFLGFDTYTEAESQQAQKSFIFTPLVELALGDVIVATATDSGNNTSEFSKAVPVASVNPGTLRFSLLGFSVGENAGTATIIVTRVGGSDGTVTVDVATSDDSASDGTDYIGKSETLTFVDGQTTQTFSVTILDDSQVESDELLGLTLSNPTGGAAIDPQRANAKLRIIDDDVAACTSTVIGSRFAAVGDFNRDGRSDLVIARTRANLVDIVLGESAGGFGAPSHVPVGLGPTGVAVGDFNGDGKPDIAVANSRGKSVSILLGDGAGAFGPETRFAAGAKPTSVATSDFNRDGKLDLAVADKAGRSVRVLLGNGDGTFGAASKLAVGRRPVPVAVADFDGDGMLDLVTANSKSNNVSLLRGRGDGTFAPAMNTPVGRRPSSIAVGDFNCDGRSDVAVANRASRDVTVLMGNAAGTFDNAGNFPVGVKPTAVAVGDFDRDGNSDIAVANSKARQVIVRMGNGQGGTTPAPDSPFTLQARPLAIIVGDFNGQGQPDFAVIDRSGGVTIVGRQELPRVTPVLDSSHSVSMVVGPAGGSIEAVDAAGVSYMLDIPADALLDQTTITMTPLSAVGNLPLSRGLIAAVQFGPDGLQFFKAATLTIDVPAGFDSSQLVGFGYHRNGDNFHLYPSLVNGSRLVFQLTHFSGIGAGLAAPEDLTAILNSPNSESTDRFLNRLVAAYQQQNSATMVGDVLRAWYNEGVKPKLILATSGDARLIQGLKEFGDWLWNVLVAGASLNDPDFFATTLDSEIEGGNTLAAAALRSGIIRANARCRNQQTLAGAEDALRWQAIAQSMGLDTAANSLDLATVRANLCDIEVIYANIQFPNLLQAGQAAELKLRVGVSIDNGPTLFDARSRVNITATGTVEQVILPLQELVDPSKYSAFVHPIGGRAVQLLINACLDDSRFPRLTALQICQPAIVIRGDIQVSPVTVELASGASQQFTAQLLGFADPTVEVTWSATGGTITSSGLFVAGSTPGTYTVTATSVADPQQRGQATVTIEEATGLNFAGVYEGNGGYVGDPQSPIRLVITQAGSDLGIDFYFLNEIGVEVGFNEYIATVMENKFSGFLINRRTGEPIEDIVITGTLSGNTITGKIDETFESGEDIEFTVSRV